MKLLKKLIYTEIFINFFFQNIYLYNITIWNVPGIHTVNSECEFIHTEKTIKRNAPLK